MGSYIEFKPIQFRAIAPLNHCSVGLGLKRRGFGVSVDIGRISFMISNVSACSVRSSVQHNNQCHSGPAAPAMPTSSHACAGR